MADFSFSFDSDNPFAEPEQAPKKAPAPTDETSNAPSTGVSDGTPPPTAAPDLPQSEETEFSLDSLDFAFDEGVSVNDSLPTQNLPGDHTPNRELTPGEAALAEFDFNALEGSETPNPQTADLTEAAPAETTLAEATLTESAPAQATPEVASPPSNSTKSASSDLEEFNALTSGFDGEADDDGGEESVDDTSPDASPDLDFDLDPDTQEMPDETALEAESLDELNIGAAVAAAPTLADETETQEEEFRPLKTKAVLSVAILGASGIGKNHARWFHQSGCRIAGFLGTSDDSIAQTQNELAQDFEFAGNAYTELEALLQTEKPDIVCVATPPPLHFGHVLQSLEAGAHVLCEKPLVYAPTRKFRENRDGAKELVKVAGKRNLNLGTQLQYGAATPILCKLAGLTPVDVGDFAMELETLNPNAPRDPRALWIDLGPHPISVAQILAGAGAHLAEDTVRFDPYEDDEKTEVMARFGINCADGRLLMVRAVVRALRGETTRKPRRRFSFNGHAVTYAPIVNARGDFRAQFVAPDGYSSVYSDPVEYLIGDFVRACREHRAPLITGDFGRENLEWMLKVGAPNESR